MSWPWSWSSWSLRARAPTRRNPSEKPSFILITRPHEAEQEWSETVQATCIASTYLPDANPSSHFILQPSATGEDIRGCGEMNVLGLPGDWNVSESSGLANCQSRSWPVNHIAHHVSSGRRLNRSLTSVSLIVYAGRSLCRLFQESQFSAEFIFFSTCSLFSSRREHIPTLREFPGSRPLQNSCWY